MWSICANFAKIRKLCENSRRLRKRAKTFLQICKKALSINELGHISSTINIFNWFLFKYAAFLQIFQKFTNYAKIRDVCENVRKRAKTFLQVWAKICKKAISINELGHISSTINIFPWILSKYAAFVQNFEKFAKIRDICKNSRYCENSRQVWKLANYVKICDLSKKFWNLGKTSLIEKKNCNVLQKWTTLSNFCIYKEIFVTLCKICKNSRLWENSQLCKTLQIMHNFVNYAKIHKLVFKLVTYIFWQGYFGKS